MVLTQEERDAAEREGWIVENDEYIARLDDPQLELHGYSNPKFESDADADLFVRIWAARGSALHQKALIDEKERDEAFERWISRSAMYRGCAPSVREDLREVWNAAYATGHAHAELDAETGS